MRKEVRGTGGCVGVAVLTQRVAYTSRGRVVSIIHYSTEAVSSTRREKTEEIRSIRRDWAQESENGVVARTSRGGRGEPVWREPECVRGVASGRRVAG